MSVSLRGAYHVWQREVAVYKYVYKGTILSNLFDPVIYLLAMGFGLGAYLLDVQGMPYIQFIAPGLVGSAVVLAASFETTWNTYVRIEHERIYDAMMATPVTVEDIVTGEVLWAVTRSIITGTTILGVLVAFGLVRSLWALLVPAVCAMGGFVVAVLGLTYTSHIRKIDNMSFYYTLYATPQFLLSGIFFPLDGLPPAVQFLSSLFPLTHIVALIRGLVLGALHTGLLWDLLWLVIVGALLFRLPLRLLKGRLVR